MLSYTVINGYFCKVTLQWHYIKANLCENCAKIVRKLCENCAKILFALLYYSNKFLYNNEIILSRYTVILFLPISLLQSKLR